LSHAIADGAALAASTKLSRRPADNKAFGTDMIALPPWAHVRGVAFGRDGLAPKRDPRIAQCGQRCGGFFAFHRSPYVPVAGGEQYIDGKHFSIDIHLIDN